eukprot:TRINITY_DN22874_c0_g1_i1.p1 TRINITY_DN22874_c0_g1~~TRINITY_DN22874_c0_g1_i1.p1  ORF type:complete len:350 (+),score=40.99 TRINITY_DN22874_c0_g1_i1:84-1133(+)
MRGTTSSWNSTDAAVTSACSTHGQGAPREQLSMSPPRSCLQHNEWKRVGRRYQCHTMIVLRCRVCAATWRTSLDFFDKCADFYAGTCTRGGSCPHPHIYSKAFERRLAERGGVSLPGRDTDEGKRSAEDTYSERSSGPVTTDLSARASQKVTPTSQGVTMARIAAAPADGPAGATTGVQACPVVATYAFPQQAPVQRVQVPQPIIAVHPQSPPVAAACMHANMAQVAALSTPQCMVAAVTAPLCAQVKPPQVPQVVVVPEALPVGVTVAQLAEGATVHSPKDLASSTPSSEAVHVTLPPSPRVTAATVVTPDEPPVFVDEDVEKEDNGDDEQDLGWVSHLLATTPFQGK